MALLAADAYDPSAGAVTKATTALLAMTAMDTTNLRHTVTVPSNGIIMARLLSVIHGATDPPAVLLGVLDGSTVRGRQAPLMAGRPPGNANNKIGIEAMFPITGLTPASSITLDAAYGVEAIIALTGIKYGGPNNTTANDAFGAFVFELWEANGLLGAKNYDPSSPASISTAAATVMTAIDTTNLRITFTTAASGPGSTSVLVKVRGGSYQGVTGAPGCLFGVLDGSTVRGRAPTLCGNSFNGTASTTMQRPIFSSFCVTGLTANTSYTWDLAMSVDFAIASSTLKYGGPDDNTTADNAWGGLCYEIWKA